MCCILCPWQPLSRQCGTFLDPLDRPVDDVRFHAGKADFGGRTRRIPEFDPEQTNTRPLAKPQDYCLEPDSVSFRGPRLPCFSCPPPPPLFAPCRLLPPPPLPPPPLFPPPCLPPLCSLPPPSLLFFCLFFFFFLPAGPLTPSTCTADVYSRAPRPRTTPPPPGSSLVSVTAFFCPRSRGARPSPAAPAPPRHAFPPSSPPFPVPVSPPPPFALRDPTQCAQPT